MAAIGQLLQGTFDDLGILGRQYLELTNTKLRGGARVAKRALVALMAGAIFAATGVAEVMYGLVGLAVATSPAVRENSRIMSLAGLASLVLASFLFYLAMRFATKALNYPKSLLARHGEDSQWQKSM